MHTLNDPISSPQQLTCAVIQYSESLGLYRAEVARILGVKCEQIGDLFEGRLLMKGGTPLWGRAEAFVAIYQRLYVLMEGDDAKMFHWLRKDNNELGTSPFLLMVDQGKAMQVLTFLDVMLDKG